AVSDRVPHRDLGIWPAHRGRGLGSQRPARGRADRAGRRRTGRLLAGPGGPGHAPTRHRVDTPAAQDAAPVAPGVAPDGARLGAHFGGPALPRARAVAAGTTPCGLSAPRSRGAHGGPAASVATGPGHAPPTASVAPSKGLIAALLRRAE